MPATLTEAIWAVKGLALLRAYGVVVGDIPNLLGVHVELGLSLRLRIERTERAVLHVVRVRRVSDRMTRTIGNAYGLAMPTHLLLDTCVLIAAANSNQKEHDVGAKLIRDCSRGLAELTICRRVRFQHRGRDDAQVRVTGMTDELGHKYTMKLPGREILRISRQRSPH